MVDSRVEKLAKLCTHYSVNVKPKEHVLMRGSTFALPLIDALYKECLLRGAYPLFLPNTDFDYTFYKYAKEPQLEFVSPFAKFLVENADVMIRVACDPNPRGLTTIDSAKIRKHRASQKKIGQIFDKRYAEGKLRWTVLPYPISAQAQEAAMPLEEYEEFVYGSCLVGKKDRARSGKFLPGNRRSEQIGHPLGHPERHEQRRGNLCRQQNVLQERQVPDRMMPHGA